MYKRGRMEKNHLITDDDNTIITITVNLSARERKAIRVINHYAEKAAKYFGLESGRNLTEEDAIKAALNHYSALLYQQHGRRW